jgi:hypothetical protein
MPRTVLPQLRVELPTDRMEETLASMGKTRDQFEREVVATLMEFCPVHRAKLGRIILMLPYESFYVGVGMRGPRYDTDIAEKVSDLLLRLCDEGWEHIHAIELPGNPTMRALRHWTRGSASDARSDC